MGDVEDEHTLNRKEDMASIFQKAEALRSKKGPPPAPRTCHFCGVLYFRREQHIIWNVEQSVHGWKYEKQTIRICLECASEDRPRKFAQTVHDVKMSGGRL